VPKAGCSFNKPLQLKDLSVCKALKQERMRRVATIFTVLLILSAILPAAESAKSLHSKGQKAENRGDYESAYDFYRQAYNQQPENLKYRVPYERTRFLAAAAKVHRGQKLRDEGRWAEALALFQKAVEIDPSNDLAAQEIRRTQQLMQKPQAPAPGPGIGANKYGGEEDPLRKRLEEATGPASLGQISNVPISALEMTEDSKLVYETIGKLANPPINVLFDPDYTPRRLTIRLQKVSLPEALDIVALQSRTFWRPVTGNTIFVAQDTQAKRRELEQNVVKTFYLGNVSGPTDLQDIVNAIRTVLEVQRIQQIPSQSAIVIKGTPDQLALAQKMIDDIDKSKPEVIVDVVVAQVRRDKLRNLGITPPQNAQVALQGVNTTTTGTNGTTSNSTGGLNFNDLQHLNSTNYAVTIDSLKAVALFSDNDSRVLESPRVRATDAEKATLKIADKIPIATGSFGTPVGIGTATGAVGVNTQFTYTEVGVILEITPRVHPDGQVTLKTVMELSNLNGSSTIGGVTQPIISTRRIEHTIRLNDGEMNLLGGILEESVQETSGGTPFLGQIPILKYLFSSTQKEKVTNELVFLLIPHIVRGQELNDLNRRAFDVGTGSGIDLHIASRTPAAVPVVSATSGPLPPGTVPPAVAQPGTTQPPAVAPIKPSPVVPTPQPATPSNATTGKPGTGGLTVLRLDPGSSNQKQGGTFTVNVQMGHAVDVASVPIQITYDPKVLQFVSVSNGEFLSRDGQPVALVHRDDSSVGKLQITAQRPAGTPGATGDGTVFSLVFMAKAKGTGTVSITIPGARNSQNQPLDVQGSQAVVTVN
jgi:general secretion pathway protein D